MGDWWSPIDPVVATSGTARNGAAEGWRAYVHGIGQRDQFVVLGGVRGTWVVGAVHAERATVEPCFVVACSDARRPVRSPRAQGDSSNLIALPSVDRARGAARAKHPG